MYLFTDANIRIKVRFSTDIHFKIIFLSQELRKMTINTDRASNTESAPLPNLQPCRKEDPLRFLPPQDYYEVFARDNSFD
jgi:hypothetical protein